MEIDKKSQSQEFEYPRFIPQLIPKNNPSAYPGGASSRPPEPKKEVPIGDRPHFSIVTFIAFLLTLVCAWLSLNNKLFFSFDQEANAVLALQNFFKPVVGIFSFFSNYSTEPLYIAVALFVYWCVDWVLGVRVLIIGSIASALNPYLKSIFNQPRPYQISQSVEILGPRFGSGMPSGHAQASSSVFGTILEQIKQKKVMVGLVFFVVMVGLSRLVLGAHLPMQVVAAWSVSAATILFVLQVEWLIIPWYKKLSIKMQIPITFVFSFIFVTVLYYIWGKLRYPAPVGETVLTVAATRDFFIHTGVIFGWTLGCSIITKYFTKETDLRWWRILIRYACGMLFVGALYFAVLYLAILKINTLTFLVATFIGLIIGAWLPWLFRRYL